MGIQGFYSQLEVVGIFSGREVHEPLADRAGSPQRM